MNLASHTHASTLWLDCLRTCEQNESLDKISAETKAYMYCLPFRQIRLGADKGNRWRMPVYTGIGFRDVK
jgi:hypothetical protein